MERNIEGDLGARAPAGSVPEVVHEAHVAAVARDVESLAAHLLSRKEAFGKDE